MKEQELKEMGVKLTQSQIDCTIVTGAMFIAVAGICIGSYAYVGVCKLFNVVW